MARKIIVYGTPTCRMVKPVRAILDKSEIGYKYVDITEDEKANERVKTINKGNASVPTILFRDGSTLTEPSTKQLVAKLESSGFKVKKLTLFDRAASFFANPFLAFLGVVDVILGSLMSANNLTILGFSLIALYLFFTYIMPRVDARSK